MSLLQMKKLRLREIKWFAHGHITTKVTVSEFNFKKTIKQTKTVGTTHTYTRNK